MKSYTKLIQCDVNKKCLGKRKIIYQIYRVMFHTYIVLVGDNFSWVSNCSLESPNTHILLNCIIGNPGNRCNFIYSKWVYFHDNIFVIKATPLNKLTYMRKSPRGVLLPASLPRYIVFI